MIPDGTEYEGKPRQMKPGERFYIWDFAEDYFHPCETHIAGDEKCDACRQWLMGEEQPYPRRCTCGGLRHYVRSWAEFAEDAYEVNTIQCDQCGQEGFELAKEEK